jgi:hypothetical protein
MIAPLSSFSPALSGMAAGSLTAMNGVRIDRFTTPRTPKAGDYKPWDVKQEGGQMDSGWGTGETLKFCDSTLAINYRDYKQTDVDYKQADDNDCVCRYQATHSRSEANRSRSERS